MLEGKDTGREVQPLTNTTQLRGCHLCYFSHVNMIWWTALHVQACGTRWGGAPACECVLGVGWWGVSGRKWLLPILPSSFL